MRWSLPVDEELRELIADVQSDDAMVAEWMAEFTKLRAQLTGELAETETAKSLDGKQAFRALVAKVGGQLR